MVAATSIGFGPVFVLLAIFGGTSLPLGLPPLPEDPILSRVAPEECLAYVSWSGTATPSAESKNQFEQLLAEPEVAQLLAKVDGLIHDKLGETTQLAAKSYPAAKTLLTRPAAVFLSKLRVTPQGPDIEAGAVFKLDAGAPQVVAALEDLQNLLPPGSVEKTTIGKFSVYKIKTPGPAITWGLAGKYLVAGVGDGQFEAILKRARGSVPAWLAEIRKQAPIERVSMVLCLDVKKIVEQFASMGGPQVKTILDATGLAGVTSLATVTGLDGPDCVSRTLINTDGEPAGALHLMAGGKPLTAADLAPIPCDATLAIAARYDLQDILATALKIAGQIDPRSQAQAAEAIKGLESELGISLENDLLKPLGDVWCLYNSPGEGGFLFTGLTGVVQVKDHDRLAATLAKLANLAQSQFGPEKAGPAGGPPRPRIEKFTFASQEVSFFNARTSSFLVAPAWCLTDKELIVSAFPQGVKAYLSRGKDYRSLATRPEVTAALGAEGGAVSITYADPRPVAQVVYPFLCLGMQAAAGEAARNGIPFDVSILPSAAAILPHLGPSVGAVRRTPQGIEISSRGSLPGLSVASLSGFAAGLFIPAVSSARQAGRRAQSMNNLRQIALAMMNYVSTFGTLPPAYTADKASGRPLLSWRVAILPFLDEQPLYQQFHRDEPWDSPNNIKLVARMPQIYRSPESHLGPGMANYLTFRHKDSVFPGKDGVGPAAITDGMSNTLMVVEADDSKAVVWTRPDDLDFQPANPLAGLGGVWNTGFLAAFCDGSVQFISTGIDEAVMSNLVNRHDGNPVDTGQLDAPPRARKVTRPIPAPMNVPAAKR